VSDVGYQPDKPADNRILRLALLQAWGYACYWCRRPRDFADVEIDHIIPKKTDQDLVDDVLLRQCLTPKDQAVEFHVHNLAPICGKCNKEKADALLAGARRFMTLLAKARTLQPLPRRPRWQPTGHWAIKHGR
jgi:5-methylcytosine-specific restriction endonuclease McrA